MQQYSEFRPTGFDAPGLGCEDRQDWLVLPISRTRDSECLEESNFHCALAILGGESETAEVHRFSHWGPGWFEIILLHPGRESDGEDIERSLEDYPVLDDEDLSGREWEAASETWERSSTRDRMEYCERASVSKFAARRDEIPEGMDTHILLSC